MAAKKKFYVVWEGKVIGIYDNWETCKNQVWGVEGAKYKAFDTMIDVAEANFNIPIRKKAGTKQ